MYRGTLGDIFKTIIIIHKWQWKLNASLLDCLKFDEYKKQMAQGQSYGMNFTVVFEQKNNTAIWFYLYFCFSNYFCLIFFRQPIVTTRQIINKKQLFV